MAGGNKGRPGAWIKLQDYIANPESERVKINKGQFRFTSKSKNLRFEIRRGKGHLLGYAWNRIKWHLYPRIHRVGEFPTHVDIEIASICDLNCPMCYTTTEEFKKTVKKGLMDLDLFKRLIDECARYNLYSIRLSLRGEAFVHPDVLEMLRYAKEKGIREVATLTHGGRIDEEKFRKLVEYGLDWLTISFDGVGETYEKIRAPLKFQDMVDKIARFKEIKMEMGSVKPVIKVQTVWPAIKDNPEEFYNIFNPITDQVASNPLIDYLHNDTDVVYEKGFTCPQLWERVCVGSSGEVMMCSNDEMMLYPIGDTNEDTIYDIWHGEKLQRAREAHVRHAGVDELSPCKHCYLPRATSRDNVRMENRLLKIDNYINREQKIGK